MDKVCPKCESKHWMTDLNLSVRPNTVYVALNWTGIPKGTSELRVQMCAECGYTELYAVNPQAVWAEWSKQSR